MKMKQENRKSIKKNTNDVLIKIITSIQILIKLKTIEI